MKSVTEQTPPHLRDVVMGLVSGGHPQSPLAVHMAGLNRRKLEF